MAHVPVLHDAILGLLIATSERNLQERMMYLSL